MKNKIEIAIIFKKEKTKKNNIINYHPDHVALGYQDEETGEFITRKGKKYAYLLNSNEKYGYALRKRILFSKESKNRLQAPLISYIREFATYYFEEVKNNTYQFVVPQVGDYEEVKFAYFSKLEPHYQYADEPDLELAKKFLKQDELFDAKKLINELKSKVIGQDKAIEDIVSILWQNTRSNVKNNILLIGPTGVGKTEMIRIIAKKLNIPTVMVDATTLTASGYVGKSVNDIIIELVRNANQNLAQASRGIIFIDEIDKKSGLPGNGEIRTEAIQDELLKLLEDNSYSINLGDEFQPYYQTISTKNITIIASGAFTELLENRTNTKSKIGFKDKINSPTKQEPITTEELYKFGLKKELLGRFPNIIELKPLSPKELIEILKNKNNQTLQEKINLLKELKIEVKIEEDLYQEIAKEAIRKNIGARGLVSAVENVFKEPMSKIGQEPNQYQSLILTKKTQENPKGYQLIKKK